MMNDKDPEQIGEFQILEDIGVAIRNPQGVVKITFQERVCTHCKLAEHEHKDLDHPLFNNNLEYLLWKHETKNKKP